MIGLAIIGAGPYGLSLAAHLRAAGVSFRIYGRAMESWEAFMPPGMQLKSHPWSSNLSAPGEGYTLQDYCREQGIAYDHALLMVSRDLFIAYGRAFQQRFAADLADKTLLRLEPVANGFRLTFADGDVTEARRVVVATGIRPFAYTPPMLAALPEGRVSHSADYGPLDAMVGRRVAVVGGGASAIDLTVLLREAGAEPTLVARAKALAFLPPAAPLPRSALKAALKPNSGLGTGWYLWLCANAPQVMHALPGPLRRHLVRHTLGPLAGPGLRERLAGTPTYLGRDLAVVEAGKDRIRINFAGASSPAPIEVEHVIAATGYRTDLGRLAFLPPKLRVDIRAVDGAPLLNAAYESSVPGLHFIGAAAAPSHGPVARFVYGVEHAAQTLTRRFAHQRRSRPSSAPAPVAAPAAGLHSRAR